MKQPGKENLDRYFRGMSEPEEKWIINQWFNTVEGEAFLSKEMKQDIDQMINDGDIPVNHPVPSAKMKYVLMREIHKQKRLRLYLKIAAVIVPLFICSTFYWLNIKDQQAVIHYNEISSLRGEIKKVELDDYTNVWLNAESKIYVPENFNVRERSLKLEGEAYFEVAKNPDKPFHVYVEGLDIEVVGTSFNVKAYPENEKIETTLDEGRINVNIAVFPTPVQIYPGEKILFETSTQLYQIEKMGDSKKIGLWRDNQLYFDDTPLQEIVQVLTRKYNVRFDIEDKDLGTLKYTICFKNETIHEIIQSLKLITPIPTEWEIEGSHIYIKKL